MAELPNKFIFRLAVFSHKMQIENFRHYVNNMRLNFSKDAENLKKEYEKEIDGITDSEHIEYIDDTYSEQYELLTKFQPLIYKKSTLVSLYTYLEHSLNNACNSLHTLYKTKASITDLRGDGIVRAKLYLSIFFDFNFGDASSRWPFILEFNKIRNCIVHSDSDITAMNNETTLRNIVTSTKGLSLIDNKFIDIDDEYILCCIDNIENFFDWVFNNEIKVA